MDNPFDAIRKRTDAIMQDRMDQEWIEREHEYHLRSPAIQRKTTLAPTEQNKSRTVDG